MDSIFGGTTLALYALAVFAIVVVALTYSVPDNFTRTRFIMTAFFIFIVATLTAAFWRYTAASLVFTIPAFVLGALAGYFVGVKAAQERLMLRGAEDYMEHFSHVHLADASKLKWWSFINFYTVAAALLLINLLGLSTVIFEGHESWALATCAFGALLLGSIAPYLVHLWTLRAKR